MRNRNAKPMLIGLGIILIVIAIAIIYAIFNGMKPQEVNLSGYVGGEKIDFLQNPEVEAILKKDYGITLNISKAGSLDMVRAGDLEERDYLWPSSQTALELYQSLHGKPLQEENIFNSPIVMYSRKYIADGLVQNGYASKDGEVYWVDMQKLVNGLKENLSWQDLKLDKLHGSVIVHTTNPAKSNSGNMFSGLVANMLNNSNVVTGQSVGSILPDLQSIFDRAGYMETSSLNLFRLFLQTGMGNKPIIAGYENQILEFSKFYADEWTEAGGDIVIMYPSPTVWSAHIMIALNPDGQKLITALNDERLQKIAWESHGFRSGVYGTGENSNAFQVPGVAEEVTRIIQVPNQHAMEEIIKLFE